MSENFTLSELIRSRIAQERGIPNEPSDDIKNQLRVTMAGLERIRAYLGNFPLRISSGYRCPALNQAVGGAKDSQHLLGQAADFICPGYGTPFEIALDLSDAMVQLGIDQLIQEGTWVHVSFADNPRHEILTYRQGLYYHGLSFT